MEQTRELLDLMNYKKIEESNWSQMIAMNKQAAPFIPADVWTDVQTNISGIDYPSLMQPIYAKYLSQEDAAKALEAAAHGRLVPDHEIERLTARLHISRSGRMSRSLCPWMRRRARSSYGTATPGMAPMRAVRPACGST